MENIFIRPPPSEDFVYYSIYFPFANSEDKNQAIIFLKETSALIISELHQFLNVYIWQKDAFNLRIVNKESVKFPDAVISVADNDGEFLLIESAQYLPSWLNPDNSENRVFIYQNNLHIIPLHQTSAADSLHIPTGELALVKAIQIIRNDSINTEANDKIQQSAFNRIFEYPEKIKQNFHHTKCHIPRKIAHLLYYNPQLVAPAVEAFYTRDLACQKMENFPPRSSMTVIVKFTKTLYAQLINQRFHPPKIFIQPPINSEKYKAFDLGMKLACGFEILFRNKNLFLKDKGLNVEKYSFNSDPEWIFFHDKLSKYGYFHNELPGSKLYTQLENVAKEQFLKNKVEINDLDDDHIGNELLPLEQMDEILKKPLTSDDLLLKNNNTEDDDSCLESIKNNRNYPDQLSSQSKSELVNSYNEPNIYSKKNDLHVQGDNDDDKELDRSVDIDLNLITNLLESFKAQEGLPGPGGTIFGKLGLHLKNDFCYLKIV
ncbi:6251_t:CDS:10 [Entrophospora sp. SA101]|nr:6251_t:CDS:10 [Entrophospora sp. SA101]